MKTLETWRIPWAHLREELFFLRCPKSKLVGQAAEACRPAPILQFPRFKSCPPVPCLLPTDARVLCEAAPRTSNPALQPYNWSVLHTYPYQTDSTLLTQETSSNPQPVSFPHLHKKAKKKKAQKTLLSKTFHFDIPVSLTQHQEVVFEHQTSSRRARVQVRFPINHHLSFRWMN